MLTPHRVEHAEINDQQFAVVLVNEEQLNQLMRRPGMRRVNKGYAPHDVYLRYQTLKRRTAAAAILVLAAAVGGFLWFMAPQPAMASMFPWSGSSAVPTLLTGASFSVTVASLDSADGATLAAARVRGLGMPAFTRRSPGKQLVYQAMVGPYASLDEAERAQRQLGSMGYRGARLFVDESLRGAPRGENAHAVETNPSVALLGAPDRLSLVFELQSEPRQVKSSRPDETTLEVDAGPMAAPAHPQQWSAPDGVHLIQQVGIESLAVQGGSHFMRARITLPEFAKANVRNEGRRVYVDLTWPLAEDDVRVPRRTVGRAPAADPAPVSKEPPAEVQLERYREAMEPIYQRVGEVKPFLLSAAQSGSVEVFAALDQTLASLESSLLAVNVPLSEAGQHQLLISATRTARRGLEPGFTGDRLAHARKAIEMFDGAMAPPIPSAQ